MKTRLFLIRLMLLAVIFMADTSTAANMRLVVQSSPLAGFKYHEAAALWQHMKVGDVLDLVRERDNPYDTKAVRVDWRGHKLGYVPRSENTDVARLLDNGTALEARISKLQMHSNPRKRIEFEIYAPL